MTHNRVWIELDLYSEPGATGRRAVIDATVCRQRAKQLSAMLRKLGLKGTDYVWFSDRDGRYCFGQVEYVTATDNGHWFNLDWLAADHGTEVTAGERQTLDELDPQT